MDRDVRHALHGFDQSAWALAALVTALRGTQAGGDDATSAARAVVRELDLDVPEDEVLVEQLAAAAAAPLLQTSRLLSSGVGSWTEQDDEALLAQGRASAQGPASMAEMLFPHLDGLLDLLASPGARMLDVGVGVAAMAVEFCRLFPTLAVVGLDVFPRALQLAMGSVAQAGLEGRIELRQQDVASLDDEGAFALAWVPAPFVPRSALTEGVPRVAHALVGGGWVLLAHGKFEGDPLENAVNRFKTAAYGGTALDDEEAEELLRSAGLEQVRTMPTPLGAPGVTVGRRR